MLERGFGPFFGRPKNMGTLQRSDMALYEINYLDRIISGDVPGRTAKDYLTWLVEKSGRYNHLKARDMEKIGMYSVPGVGFAWGDGEHFVTGSSTAELAYSNRSKDRTCIYGGCEFLPDWIADMPTVIGMYKREFDNSYSWWNGKSFGWVSSDTEEAYRRREEIQHNHTVMPGRTLVKFEVPVAGPSKVGMYKVILKGGVTLYYSWWNGSHFMHRTPDPAYAYKMRDDSARRLDDHATWEWANWDPLWIVGHPPKPGVYNVKSKEGGGQDGNWFSYWDGATWHHTDNNAASAWDKRTGSTSGVYVAWKDFGWKEPKVLSSEPTEVGMYHVTTTHDIKYFSWWDGKNFCCWCNEASDAYAKRNIFPHPVAHHKSWTKVAWTPPKEHPHTCGTCGHKFSSYKATYPNSDCTRSLCPDPGREPSIARRLDRETAPKSSTPVAMAPRAVRVSASRRLLLLS